jgi:hypothetical protein
MPCMMSRVDPTLLCSTLKFLDLALYLVSFISTRAGYTYNPALMTSNKAAGTAGKPSVACTLSVSPYCDPKPGLSFPPRWFGVIYERRSRESLDSPRYINLVSVVWVGCSARCTTKLGNAMRSRHNSGYTIYCSAASGTIIFPLADGMVISLVLQVMIM